MQIPVCNRGGASVPAGQVLNVTVSTYSGGCGGQACAGSGAADCSYTLTSLLAPGGCVVIPATATCNLGSGDSCLQVNQGNTVVDVHGHKECNTTASGATWPVNGAGAGCTDNDAYVKNSPAGCEVCTGPAVPTGSPALNSWNVSYSCVPSQ